MEDAGVTGRLFAVGTGPGGIAWAVGYSCPSGFGQLSEADRSLVVHWDSRG